MQNFFIFKPIGMFIEYFKTHCLVCKIQQTDIVQNNKFFVTCKTAAKKSKNIFTISYKCWLSFAVMSLFVASFFILS